MSVNTHCRFCKLPYATQQFLANGGGRACNCHNIKATRHDVYVLEEKMDKIIEMLKYQQSHNQNQQSCFTLFITNGRSKPMVMARIIIEDVTGDDVIIKCDVQRKDEYTKAEKLAMVIFEKLMASLNEKETKDGDNARTDS